MRRRGMDMKGRRRKNNKRKAQAKMEKKKDCLRQFLVHGIQNSLRCATTRTAGSGWTGSRRRRRLASWATGLDTEDPLNLVRILWFVCNCLMLWTSVQTNQQSFITNIKLL